MPQLRRKLSQIEDYPAHLEKMWRKHRRKKADNAPAVISTFSGCGGSSLGYSMAGYKELLAVEWDDNAVETFKLNFPEIPVYHGDIAKLSVEECLKMADIKSGELDVLDGSPPCQGFSTAGKRQLDDSRNQLFMEFVRLLKGLQPKVFVMENVSGMVKGKMKLIFAEILQELKASGYKVSVRLLNAMYFGVPQSRQRLIFIGVREDLNIEPSYPLANYIPIIARDSIGDIDNETDRKMTQIVLDYAAKHPGGWSTNQNIYKKVKGNLAGCMSLKWLEWSKICGTMAKSEISLTGIVHPNRNRYLNLNEAKRIGSFPDEFLFTDRKRGWERIGNSVPPLMMEAIARHIRKVYLDG